MMIRDELCDELCDELYDELCDELVAIEHMMGRPQQQVQGVSAGNNSGSSYRERVGLAVRVNRDFDALANDELMDHGQVLYEAVSFLESLAALFMFGCMFHSESRRYAMGEWPERVHSRDGDRAVTPRVYPFTLAWQSKQCIIWCVHAVVTAVRSASGVCFRILNDIVFQQTDSTSWMVHMAVVRHCQCILRRTTGVSHSPTIVLLERLRQLHSARSSSTGIHTATSARIVKAVDQIMRAHKSDNVLPHEVCPVCGVPPRITVAENPPRTHERQFDNVLHGQRITFSSFARFYAFVEPVLVESYCANKFERLKQLLAQHNTHRMEGISGFADLLCAQSVQLRTPCEECDKLLPIFESTEKKLGVSPRHDAAVARLLKALDIERDDGTLSEREVNHLRSVPSETIDHFNTPHNVDCVRRVVAEELLQ